MSFVLQKLVMGRIRFYFSNSPANVNTTINSTKFLSERLVFGMNMVHSMIVKTDMFIHIYLFYTI